MSRPVVIAFVVAAALVAGAAIVVWHGADSPVATSGLVNGAPPPPPAPTPSRQAFAGTSRCAECHPSAAEQHAASGHSRTFAGTRDSAIARRLCGRTEQAAAPYSPFEYVCDEQGLTVAIPDRFPTRLFPLDFALGSGDHAVTFVTLLQETDGSTVGIEHRLTWFHAGEELDLTPGQAGRLPNRDVEFFGRIIESDDIRRCIGCHTTAGTIHGNQIHDIIPGVQCESCHGPGRDHAEAADQDNLPAALRAILRPADAAAEVDLCGRCHRLPKDILPERLKRYPPSLIRFQPVGLLQSRCYTESAGKLRCTTCHDPHGPVRTRTADDQIATCRSCHGGDEQTHCPVSPSDDCLRCHMPARELVRGISFHDHWIRIPSPEGEPVATPRNDGHAVDGDDHAVGRGAK